MRSTFGKGLVIGTVVTSMVLLGAPALAGSGVGGVFHLGKTNKVKRTTALVNNGPGPALKLKSRPGAPALAVSNSKKVGRLNADMVDGLSANQLSRVTASQKKELISVVQFSVLRTATLVAPKAGYVVVTGHESAIPAGGASCTCSSHLRVRHVQSDTVSPLGVAAMQTTTSFASNTVTGLFPVAAGTNTFELMAGGHPGAADVNHYEETLTALYVPFDGVGTVAPLPERQAPKRPSAHLGSGVLH